MAWRRRHPRQAVGGLVLLAALLVGAGWWGYASYSAHARLRAARQALDRHEWAKAREHLEAYRRARPGDPAAHLLAARAARRLERLDEAQEQLDACQRLQGGETQATRVERALLRVHRGDLAGAEDFLRRRVAENDPDAPEILDVLSAALILDYRVAEAHQCLDDLLRRQPDNFDALVRRAWTAQNLTWYTVAVESLQRALDLRPGADGVRLSLVQNLVTLGRYAEAREHLTYLGARQPDNPAVTFGLARCLAGQGEKERAAELLDRLLAREPDNWTVLGERGWLCLQMDRPEQAEDYLRRAQSLAPPEQALLTHLADCLRLLGKADEARPYREEADRIRADKLRALHLGQRLREGGRNDPDLCHELGCVLLRLGKDQDALHFFQKALALDPHHRPTHESLAAFYAKVGAFEQAAAHQRQLGPNPVPPAEGPGER
jgi:predicted Zn-dependent protease